MQTIGLVSCGKGKLVHAAPARRLYTSTLFRLASAYAEAKFDRWFILSAKHGLVHPDTVLEPYEQRLTKAEGKGWAVKVAAQIVEAGEGEAALFVLAGEDYVGPLAEVVEVHVPLDGLQIGERLSWLKKNAGRERR